MSAPMICGCGCGQVVSQQRMGRQRQYVDARHRQRAARIGVNGVDLPAEQIEALIEQARQQQRYARVMGVGR